ncbi:hypothetical protein HYFRA_00012718 [Hymenoscyphus fraxineus]|uniref:Major facilitator superfamily (MFS) profile domain-containing protein n=1 Tax=Hymenoscyphus fraxineus TaxID=746836 RepID=A0A9N9PYA9_9HELO|nr:hypothetical protein HYFRA_00012718 [Hymenoscyphus fraxineus]
MAGMRVPGKDEENNTELASECSGPAPETDNSLNGPRSYFLICGKMLGVYLVGLDTTMLTTVTPTLTNYFGTISDISWYNTAYVITA